MDNELIIRALKQVPEARLLLTDLAWQMVREDGSLDPEKTAFLVKELGEAMNEARGYAQATSEAATCLRQMARS